MKQINKYLLPLLATVILIITGVSCSKDDESIVETPTPIANFNADVIPDNPQLVSFSNTSENATEFWWNFGDGTEGSTQKHPTHQYTEPGIFTVSLTAMNGDKSAEMTKEMTVDGIPTASFAYEADEDNSLTIHFENLSQNVNTFSWDFGDGTGTSTEQDPSYTYSETGIYTVTLTASGDGGSAETNIQVEVTDPTPDYDKLYIVGDASASGWNISTPEAFIQSESNPFIFSYEAKLTPGNFKISTFTGDWCDGDWLNAAEANSPISESSDFIITQGCDGPDNQWVVTQETQGRYTITINLGENTVFFKEKLPEFSMLFAIGDATPNGWNPQDPSEGFIQSESDPFVFTYEANLSPGALKISTFAGEWCDGKWLNASEADQSIANAEYIVTNACDGPDNKWRVSAEAAGNYRILVDTYNETITFEAQ